MKQYAWIFCGFSSCTLDYTCLFRTSIPVNISLLNVTFLSPKYCLKGKMTLLLKRAVLMPYVNKSLYMQT